MFNFALLIWEDLGKLGAISVIRTFFNYVLNQDLEAEGKLKATMKQTNKKLESCFIVILSKFLRAVPQKAGGNRGQIYRDEIIPIELLLQ